MEAAGKSKAGPEIILDGNKFFNSKTNKNFVSYLRQNSSLDTTA